MKRMLMCALFLFCALPFWLIADGDAIALTAKAQEIFEQNNPAVYQIRVIDIKSHEKSIIGSGFRISADGLFATNYHVISDVVDKPEHYRIEYHREGRKEGTLSLEAIDVAHDLAILKGKDSGDRPLALGTSELKQGSQVFPMGNPLDVGMVIVEGTYNGRVGDAPYKQILLSAAINSGMSGGPAFDSRGKVAGVNVSIQGNDLSYLVPVEYLKQLEKQWREKGRPLDWADVIQKQVLKRFDHVISTALKSEWTFANFGSLKVPQNLIGQVIKCWGKSQLEDPSKKRYFFYGYKWCESEKEIYLSSDLSAGTIGYAFFWLESKSLSPLEFYKKFSREYSKGRFYREASEEEVTEFSCQNHFVKIATRDWKGAYCVRRYKKYPELHDVFLSFAILGDSPRKYIIQVGLSGLNESLARKFLKKFLGEIQWAG